MTWVILARVAVKWFVAEARSGDARAVLVTDDDWLLRLGKQARLGKWVKALATFQSVPKQPR